MPFPLQRVQTDRGGEFFAYEVQDRLRDRRLKFRPIWPRSPHLNGKVERVQRTALEEFWAAANLEDPNPRPAARGVADLLQPAPSAQRPRRQDAGGADRGADRGADGRDPDA